MMFMNITFMAEKANLASLLFQKIMKIYKRAVHHKMAGIAAELQFCLLSQTTLIDIGYTVQHCLDKTTGMDNGNLHLRPTGPLAN